LEDQAATQLLAFNKIILADGGRLIRVEPSHLRHQGKWARWLMSKDRGGHIRGEQEWKHLVQQIFERYPTRIITGLLPGSLTFISALSVSSERSVPSTLAFYLVSHAFPT
jgi:hypothetical protein